MTYKPRSRRPDSASPAASFVTFAVVLVAALVFGCAVGYALAMGVR